MNQVLYLIPDWGTMNKERDKLISNLLSDKTVNIFLTPVPAGFQYTHTVQIPEKTKRLSFPGFDVVYIKLPKGVTYIPIGELKSKEESPLPLILIFRGDVSSKSISNLSRELSPSAWIFTDNHYELKQPIKGKPAVSCGAGIFSYPFIGQFPHILRIELSDEIHIRPFDQDGFLVSSSIVTADMVSRITALEKAMDISFSVEEWHKGTFEKAIELPISNTFQKPLEISFKAEGDSPWKLSFPEEFTVKPGSTKTLVFNFTVASVQTVTPVPQISYLISVGGIKAASGTIKPEIHSIKKPE